MRFLKDKKGIIISFIIGVIIASSITVYATSYFAKDITYKDGKSVEYALNDLYSKALATENIKFYQFEHTANTQFDYDFGFIPSKFLAFMQLPDGRYVTISLNITSNSLVSTVSDNGSLDGYISMNSTKLVSNISTDWSAYKNSYTIYAFAIK